MKVIICKETQKQTFKASLDALTQILIKPKPFFIGQRQQRIIFQILLCDKRFLCKSEQANSLFSSLLAKRQVLAIVLSKKYSSRNAAKIPVNPKTLISKDRVTNIKYLLKFYFQPFSLKSKTKSISKYFFYRIMLFQSTKITTDL